MLIHEGLKDPRVGMVTITAVQVSKDLGVASVYVSVYGSDQDREQSLEALNHAAGFLRKEIGRRMSLRRVPELRFRYDASIVEGLRMDELIASALAQDQRKQGDDDEEK